MAFDFKKILDFINPTYAQLKGLLIASVGTIGMVWFISAKTTNMMNTTKETNELTKQNTEMIKEIQSQMVEDRANTKSDINKLYVDILDMNTRNNVFWNTKFGLLINYGSSNKNLLLDLLKAQDEQQKLYEQDRLKNMEYEPDVTIKKETPPDTSKYNGEIVVKPILPGTKPGTLIDTTKRTIKR